MKFLIETSLGKLLLLFGLCLVVWGQTVQFDFVWDDQAFVENLQSIRSLSNIPEMFTSLDAQATDAESYKVYRPLRNVIYAILYTLGGKEEPQPWIYHTNNILWQAFTCWLLALLGTQAYQRLIQNPSSTSSPHHVGLWAGILFAVHPTLSEVVCWVKGLDDIMATAFCLASTLVLIRNPNSNRNVIGSLIFYALALYSKVSALPLCILLAGMVWLTSKKVTLKTLVTCAMFGVVGFLYFLHRHHVIGQSHQVDPISGSYGQTLIDMLPVVLTYSRLMLGTPPFLMDYTFMEGGHHIFSLPVILGTLLLLGLLMATILALKTPSTRLIGWGFVWTGLFLLPVSNLMPMMQYMAERFLYLSLAGWVLALTALGFHFLSTSARNTLFIALTLIWGATAVHRSTIWENNFELFIRSAVEGPRTLRVEANAVRAVLDMDHMRASLDIQSKPRIIHTPPSTKPSIVQPATAVDQSLTSLLQLFPGNSEVLTAIGVVAGKRGDEETALKSLQDAITSKSNDSRAWAVLAQIHQDLNQPKLAMNAIKHAWEQAPNEALVQIVRANLLWEWGQQDEALALYQILLKRYPNVEIAKERVQEYR